MSRVHGEHLASVPSMWRIGVAGAGDCRRRRSVDKGDALPFTGGSRGVLIVMGGEPFGTALAWPGLAWRKRTVSFRVRGGPREEWRSAGPFCRGYGTEEVAVHREDDRSESNLR